MTDTEIPDGLKPWQRESIEATPGANLYFAPGITVYASGKAQIFYADQHSHEEYEFMMPLNDDVASICEGKSVIMERQKMFPFNSLQRHGVASDIRINKAICLIFEKAYLEKVCCDIFGTANITFENKSFEPGSAIHFMLGLFIEESIEKRPGYEHMQGSLARAICIEVLRRSFNNISCALLPKDADSNTDKAGIIRAADFINEQSALDFSLSEAAAVAGMSPYYFIRQFKALTGQTPYNYYIASKIERAKVLLKDKGRSITETALACGFSSSSRFSIIFRRVTKMTPSEYRNKYC